MRTEDRLIEKRAWIIARDPGPYLCPGCNELGFPQDRCESWRCTNNDCRTHVYTPGEEGSTTQ